MLGSKISPFFAVTLVALGLLSAIEIGYCVERRRAALRAERRCAKKWQEWREFGQTVPAVTNETAEAIAADLVKINQALAVLRGELSGRGAVAERLDEGPSSMKSTDAFFELTAFAERVRAQAARSGVKLRPDEWFGFSAYIQQGPEPEFIRTVFRQRVVTQYLAEALIAAGPHQLLGFQRERPRPFGAADLTTRDGAPAPERRFPERSSTSGQAASDLFRIDPRISVEMPQRISTMAFRLSFLGRTATLRAFLQTLARFDLPLLVRTIEVEPASPAEAKPLARNADFVAASANSFVLTADSVGAPRLVVPQTLSKFIITVEYFELVSARGNGGDVPLGAPAT